MANPFSKDASLATRAQRLYAIGAITPISIFVLAGIAGLLGYDPPPDDDGGYNFLIVCGLFIGIAKVCFTWSRDRNEPASWPKMTAVHGGYFALLIAMTTLSRPDGQRFGLDTPTLTAVVLSLCLGIVIVGWLLAWWASRMVFADLSQVVSSRFAIGFRSRVMFQASLSVTPDSLDLVWQERRTRARLSYQLAYVSSITVRTAMDNKACPVPGHPSQSIRVTPGKAVVIDLPAGQLVFPTKDAHRLRKFAEARIRALAGDR